MWHWFKSKRRKVDKGPLHENAVASGEQLKNAQEDPLFSSDKPIQSKKEDRFNRWVFAERVAQTLSQRSDLSCIVVGIYAAWGDGKTSTLQMIEEALEKKTDIAIVRFNPWRFQSEESLIRGFFDELAHSVGTKLPNRKKELSKILGGMGMLLSIASVTVGHVVKIDPGAGLEKLGKSISSANLDQLKSGLERILNECRKKIVIFIDDIDRLDKAEIQTIFKLVKLSAGFERTSYVLAFDDEMVASALGEKYGGGGVEAGRNFLEKIVQVPLRLPPPDQLELRRLTFEGVDNAIKLAKITLLQDEVEAFGRHFVDGLEPALKTPRQARLYTNALSFALPILKGEVNPIDQILLEGVRVFYPKLYECIRGSSELFLSGRRERQELAPLKQKIEHLISDATRGSGVSAEVVIGGLLIPLFPRLKEIVGNMAYGNGFESEWANKQKVCSKEYFDRYFSYCVPKGDPPDKLIEELIISASEKSQTEINAMFTSLAGEGRMERLVTKLRRREKSVSAIQATRLAVATAHNGSFLPRGNQALIPDWAFSQGGILISNLLRRVHSASERAQVGKQIVDQGESLVFAAECIRWMRHDEKDDQETDRIFTSEDEKAVCELLAKKIRLADQKSPIYESFGSDAPRLYFFWNKFGPPGELRDDLIARLNRNLDEVDLFIACFNRRGIALETRLSVDSDFDRENYNAIAKYIDPEYLASRLREKYGSLINNSEYHQKDDVPFALATANQYLYIHEKALEENGNVQSDLQPPPT